jgi:hypothetical protein
MQEALGRRVLIENPASYLRYRHSSIPETEFLTDLPPEKWTPGYAAFAAAACCHLTARQSCCAAPVAEIPALYSATSKLRIARGSGRMRSASVGPAKRRRIIFLSR